MNFKFKFLVVNAKLPRSKKMVDHELQCPHCHGWIVVSQAELNCRIFRHAVYAANMQPLNPHAPKHVCESLLASGVLLGCARPFRVVNNPDGTLSAVACEYI